MQQKDKSREHLANERTFLAWIRTAVGIMAFGFVVMKFSLFLRQLAFIVQADIVLPQTGYSSIAGIVLVAFGVIVSVIAYIQYRRVEKQLKSDAFTPSRLLPTMLIAFMVLTGSFLLIYLISTV